jgi:hypothetical protein
MTDARKSRAIVPQLVVEWETGSTSILFSTSHAVDAGDTLSNVILLEGHRHLPLSVTTPTDPTFTSSKIVNRGDAFT